MQLQRFFFCFFKILYVLLIGILVVQLCSDRQIFGRMWRKCETCLLRKNSFVLRALGPKLEISRYSFCQRSRCQSKRAIFQRRHTFAHILLGIWIIWLTSLEYLSHELFLKYGNLRIVKYLIEKGANLSLCDIDGQTPLYTVVEVGFFRFSFHNWPGFCFKKNL